jgi:SAM-dependent methyltransferase
MVARRRKGVIRPAAASSGFLDSNEDTLLSSSLWISHGLALTFDWDGVPILYSFAHPESHVRISEAERVLLSCFSASTPVRVADAMTVLSRLWKANRKKSARSAALTAARRLVKIGALAADRGIPPLYTAEMVSYYAKARQIPREVAGTIALSGAIEQDTAILDMGTGTGSLAVELAKYSKNVTGIDIGDAFLDTARAAAEFQGASVFFRNACANKLVLFDGKFDLVVISQAFHWLDTSSVVRGVYRALKPGGLLYFLESKPVLPESHPFRKMFGFGFSSTASMKRECLRHLRWCATRLEALKPPDLALGLKRVWLLHRRQAFDLEFARAYFFPQALKQRMPEENDPWATLGEALSVAGTVEGDMYWLLMQFRNAKCTREPYQMPELLPELSLFDEVELP